VLKLFVSYGAWLGLGLVALGLLLPFWVQPEYVGIVPLMESLRSTPTGNSLILAVFFLMLCNTLYSLPYYLGSFLLADEIGERMQRTWIKAALPLAAVPLLSFAVQQYNSLEFAFGVPDILLLLAMLILQKLAKGRLSFSMKSFILMQLLIGFQSLEVVPFLSATGFGSHPYLLEIKQVSWHIGFDQALNIGGLFVCFILLINTAILSAFFMLSLQKWNDRKTLHLAQLEAIQSRSGREVLHLVHDLKTPLTSMEGLVSLIEMRVHDEKIKEYCRICSSSISSMSEMISEMLYEDRKSWFRLEEVMDYVRASRLSGTNVSVDMDMPVEDNIYIWVNKIRVTRALVNLLDNALDAIKDKENGRVTLHARVQGNEVSLGVSDNGPGIPPDKQERVWQAGYSTKRHPGLGLAFVKQVAEGHNGSVTIQSGIGEGTTVWMHLWGGERADENINYG
jgi:two-component system sporulation sensor kinase B